jgi:Cysteine dioxygenase type I
VTAATSSGVPARAAVSLAELTDRLPLGELPGRDLDQHELMSVVTALAADPDRWREDVAFGTRTESVTGRHYVCLYRDTHVDVWLLCWTPSDDTGWHDHDVSSGAIAVVDGCLVEHNLAVAAPSLATEVAAGRVFTFGPDHIHRLTGRDANSVSIHAYSPPLWRMGQYAVSDAGVLRRLSVSYADELRPLD